MKTALYLLLLFFAFACQKNSKSEDEELATKEISQAQQIVDAARFAHGSELVEEASIKFTFRDRLYKSIRDGGMFQYERVFEDSVDNTVRDVLNNEGFFREINGETVELDKEKSDAYTNSVNSVIYFALLPYNLNDRAVNKTYIGTTNIKGEPYHQIKVTFGKEKGGKDYEDEFVYFFHTEKNTMDYLAYNYLTDGGGARFREAYNQREVEGILFADFINYKPMDAARRDVENFDELFKKDSLQELSRIETKEIEVVINPEEESI